MKPWVVVPCSGAKRDVPSPAGEMYLGSLHRLALGAARTLVDGDDSRIRIASARYGLVELDRVIAPYDRRIESLARDDLRQWKSWVHCDAIGMLNDDLAAQGLPIYTNDYYDRMARVVALTPAAYTDALRDASPLLARMLQTPLAACGGIGVMKQRLRRIRDRIPKQEAML